MSKEQPDFRQMTADTIGKDLLSALVTEIRLLTGGFHQPLCTASLLAESSTSTPVSPELTDFR